MEHQTMQSPQAAKHHAPKTPFVKGRHTYRAGCHCGAWRYEIALDLTPGTTRCNCTWCSKHGWWGAIAKPEDFRLLAAPETQREAAEKTPGLYEVFRPHCTVCGVIPFGRGDIPEIGGQYVSVNVRALEGVSLSGVTVRYLDGLHDTWAVVREATFDDPFAATDVR